MTPPIFTAQPVADRDARLVTPRDGTREPSSLPAGSGVVPAGEVDGPVTFRHSAAILAVAYAIAGALFIWVCW